MTSAKSVGAIDAVCNILTTDAFNRRPSWMITDFYDKIPTAKPISVEQMIERMDRAGIKKAFIPAVKCGTWEIPYEMVAKIVDAHPDRFYGMAGIDPTEGMDGVRNLVRAVKDFGFIAAHSYPHWFNLSPDAAKFYPFYAKCVELGIPIEIQVGHAGPTRTYTVAHPILLDRIAIDFPELKIVGIHTGYPWVEEMISVCWKHRNVYVGCDAIAPKYWPPNLVHYIKTYGKEKVIFGTDFPIVDWERAMMEIDEIGFSDEVLQKLLRKNAEKVFLDSH